jgi:hypothetical protein
MPRPHLFAAAALAGWLLSACGSSAPAPAPTVEGFSGVKWSIKTYQATPWGPGPNYFSASPENVRVDSSGFLHLRISERGGRWYCAEVISDRSFSYGTYVFVLGSRGDTLDPNAVLGLFTWDDAFDAAQVNHFREIDFEFSRWGDPLGDDFQFVVQPWDLAPGNIHRFEIDSSDDATTVHAFTWSASGVVFTSAHGSAYPPSPASVIEAWGYAGAATPVPGQEKVHLNLWLVSGLPPASGLPQEVVVRRFQFLPP